MPFVSRYDHTAVWPDDLPLPPGVRDGERRFDVQHRGPWSIISVVRGLAVEKQETGVVVYGDRALNQPREDGYVMRGTVSIGGRARRSFTASQMFVHRGKLLSFAILYVGKGAAR